MNCGSWSNLRIYFCEKCHQKCLSQFQNQTKTKIENLIVKSLFKWPPGESDVLSTLILQMKEERTIGWQVWAEEFVLKWNETQSGTDQLFVSSVSLSGKDHAQNWGKALSSVMGSPHACLLRPSPKLKNQKEASRSERKERIFHTIAPVDFSRLHKKRVIFVDDVVTTGQTALAAYKALGKPDQFEVWSLIYREL